MKTKLALLALAVMAITTGIAKADTDPERCASIRIYCSNQWLIGRNNWAQYASCVGTNADNSGLLCTP